MNGYVGLLVLSMPKSALQGLLEIFQSQPRQPRVIDKDRGRFKYPQVSMVFVRIPVDSNMFQKVQADLEAPPQLSKYPSICTKLICTKSAGAV